MRILAQTRTGRGKMRGVVLTFIAEHEVQHNSSRKRARDSASVQPPCSFAIAGAHGDDDAAVARDWADLEDRWWVAAWPALPCEATAAMCVRTRAAHASCAFNPRRLVRASLGRTDAPLLTAWALHNAGILPLVEWFDALRLPVDAEAWAGALAELHHRAFVRQRHLDAGANPFASLLKPLCDAIMAIACENVSPHMPPARVAAEATLHAYLTCAPRGSSCGHGKSEAAALRRCSSLLRAASALPGADVRAQFVTAQLASLVRTGRDTHLGSAEGKEKEEEEEERTAQLLAALSQAATSGADADVVSIDVEPFASAAAARRECVGALASVLGASGLGAAMIDALLCVPRGQSVEMGTHSRCMHERWARLALSMREAAPAAAAVLARSLLDAAQEALCANGSKAAGGSDALHGMPLAALILMASLTARATEAALLQAPPPEATHGAAAPPAAAALAAPPATAAASAAATAAATAAAVDDTADAHVGSLTYAEWLDALATSAAHGGGKGGGAGKVGGGKGGGRAVGRAGAVGASAKRAACVRLVRAMSSMVPVQSALELRTHIALCRNLLPGWQAAGVAGAGVELADYLLLLRTRLVDVDGSGAVPGAEAAVAERAEKQMVDEAAREIEGALDRMERDGGLKASAVPENLKRLRFLNARLWMRHVTPRLLAKPPRHETFEARRAHRQQLQLRLVELLRAAHMLPPAPSGAAGGAVVAKRGLQAGSLPRPLVGIEGGPAASDDPLTDVAVSLPLDWAGLLAALPRLAARATSAPWTAMPAVSPFAAALSALVPAMRPPRRAGEADGRGAGDAGDAGLLPAGEALRCCGGRVSAVLSTVLEAFAHCLAESGPLSTDAPMTAPSTALSWAPAFVEALLWKPQQAWPQLHGALWGWVRLAIAGEAGCHERPLAYLLLLLGSAQRAECAQSGHAPPACAQCDAQLTPVFGRAVAGARCARGCHVDALLSLLPVGCPRQRAWSMRLGASCLEAASFHFDWIDVGAAPPESWRAHAASEGGARDVGGVEPPAAPAGSAAVRVGGSGITSAPSRALLPAATLQLLQWLSRKEVTEPAEQAARAELRRCLELPGGRLLLAQEACRVPDRAVRAWEALAGAEPGASLEAGRC